MSEINDLQTVRDGLVFHKSSHSQTGNCVMYAAERDGAAVCDSKAEDGPVLRFKAGGWTAFTRDLAAGAFDPS
ncbi:DUF397 domain-containing protein [Saccharothrix stipae]